jgi:hypothetical protein
MDAEFRLPGELIWRSRSKFGHSIELLDCKTRVGPGAIASSGEGAVFIDLPSMIVSPVSGYWQQITSGWRSWVLHLSIWTKVVRANPVFSGFASEDNRLTS